MARWLPMTVPYRTVLALGLAVGMLGAGYVFAPHPGAAALPVAQAATPSPSPVSRAPVVDATPAAAPAAKPVAALAVNRAPVPLAPRRHDSYYVTPSSADPALQTASTTAGPGATAPTTATDGAALPSPDDAKSGDSAQAKAAIEFDGYKNVRGLVKGPDGLWRGRAMRGRTEISVTVDASGSVSAE